MNAPNLNPDNFESRSETVNGVQISLKETKDYEGDLHTLYELTLYADGDIEAIKIEDSDTAVRIFERVVQSVPADHPQKLYIAYGIAKQMLRSEESIADDAIRAQHSIDRARKIGQLDTSYSESAETNSGVVSVAWNPKSGSLGSYVITFPGEEFRIAHRSISEIAPGQFVGVWPVSVRPDLAKQCFNFVVEMLNKGRSVESVQEELDWRLGKYSDTYLHSSEPMAHPDMFYEESITANGIEIRSGWNEFNQQYFIMIGGEEVLLGNQLHTTKDAFQYACQKAKLGRTPQQIARDVSEYIASLEEDEE